MIKSATDFYRKRPKLAASVVGTVLLLVLMAISCQRYLFAIAWHCVHGNSAEMASYRIKVPLFWWKADTDVYGESRLVRATSIFASDSAPEVTVDLVNPGKERATNDDEMKAVQQLVARQRQSAGGTSTTFVLIHSGLFDLSCFKHFITPPPGNILVCRATGIRYSFNYDGPSIYEKEAESIFSSLN